MTGLLVSNLRLAALLPERQENGPSWQEFPRRFLALPEVQTRLTPIDRNQLRSLSAERDPQLLLECLLGLGSRWERQGRDSEALRLYQEMLAASPPDLAGYGRLHRRAEVLQGRGGTGARFEHAARHFVRQATDPAMIFGFLIGGGVATAVRGWSLGSLALRAEGLLSRGWRARALAGGAAYVAEVPAFVGATRLAQGALGYEQGFGEWATLPEALGGAALFLGALKLSGLGAQALAGRSAFRPLVLGGGTLGGIYAGHRLEESFGLRPAQEEVQRWFDAGETFLQLRVAGRLASGLFGAGHGASLETGLRLQRLATEGVAPRPRWNAVSARPLEVAASVRLEEDITQPILREELNAELLQARFGESLGPRATPIVVQSVQSVGKRIKLGEPLVRMVQDSQYWDSQGFELAMRRLHYATHYAFPRGLTGSYLNWVVRVAAETAVRRGDQARFDRLLQYLAEGASIDQLETLASELDPRLRLFPENLLTRNLRIAELMTMRSESHRMIRALPLPKEAKQSLHAYDRVVPMSDRVHVVRAIRDWLQKYPEHQEMVRDVLVRARLSPAGMLRTQRMINVLMYESTHLAKLRELLDMDLGIRGRNAQPPFHETELILGSQDDGYVAEPELARELSLLYRRLPDLLDVAQASARRARTQRILEQVWPDNQTPVDVPHLRRALALLGDPIADAIERNLDADRFRLVLLPRPEFNALFEGAESRYQRRNFGGLFTPADRDASGRDSIYLMTVEAASHAAYRDLALMRLVQLVHEHVHFVRAPFQTNRGLRGTYLEEMLAEAQAFRWQAEQGDVRLLKQYMTANAAGLGLYFRDWVNLTYFILEDRES